MFHWASNLYVRLFLSILKRNRISTLIVNIFYTRVPNKISDSLYRELISKLPIELKLKNYKYLRWQDKLSHLFGKLLLINAVKILQYQNCSLSELDYTLYGRPFFFNNKKIDFNISHSGQYVLCSIAQEIQTGIDVEKIREIKFEDYISVMSEQEWELINSSANPLTMFYTFWTKKESSIKADGRGLSINLKEVVVAEDSVFIGNSKWHIKELKIDHAHLAFVATNLQDFSIKTTFLPYCMLNFHEE